jgi:hypothetical protein
LKKFTAAADDRVLSHAELAAAQTAGRFRIANRRLESRKRALEQVSAAFALHKELHGLQRSPAKGKA